MVADWIVVYIISGVWMKNKSLKLSWSYSTVSTDAFQWQKHIGNNPADAKNHYMIDNSNTTALNPA